MTAPSRLRVGTRGSALARAQTHLVIEMIRAFRPEIEVETEIVQTAADRAPELPLSAIGDKAVWVAELEQRLLSGSIDLAVHSLKDLPAELAPGLAISAVPERECPLDALVLPGTARTEDLRYADPAYAGSAIHYHEVQEALDRLLPEGARVGTSSDRRKGQLLSWRPDLKISPVRGNVDTRLRKLDAGEWDVLILAAAGLRRLGRADRITALFPVRLMVPAPGQGALGIEIRGDDNRLREILKPLQHGPSAAAVAAERSLIRTVGGGCSIPLGAFASIFSDCLELWIRAVDPEPGPETRPVLQDLELIDVPEDEDAWDNLEWAEELGRSVGERFLKQGGSEFIAAHTRR